MSEKIKIEIEIPPPPEGWGEVEFRRITLEETDVKFWDGSRWVDASDLCTAYQYPVARKLPPPWTPPSEWHAMFGDCWLVVDSDKEVKLSRNKPKCAHGVWESGEFWVCFNWDMIVPEMLPPKSIPWHKCCFKIGEPDE